MSGRQKVVIRLNGEPLCPNNPVGHPLAQVFEERRIELPGEEPEKGPILSIRAVVIPNESEMEEYLKPLSPEERRVHKDRLTLNGRANDAQGFYFYRLHRLIKWGGWEDLFAKDEHTKLLRVAVDFDRLADEPLQVDISKQVIRLPVAVSDHVKEILKGARAAARSRYDKKPKPAKTPPTTRGNKEPPGSTPSVPSTNEPGLGAAYGGTPFTDITPAPPAKKDRPALRLVTTGPAAWERKMGFGGEHVEITPRVPQLVALVQAIDKDGEAKVALSEFLRVLESAGVPKLLVGES